MEVADLGKEGAGVRYLERITALDRSTTSFSEQLTEACTILQINFTSLHTKSHNSAVITEVHFEYGPTEEWMFRWLLRRFDLEQVDVTSPSLSAEAWNLLRYLLLCLPPNIAAKSLKASHLVRVISVSLSWLAEHGVFHAVPTSDSSKRKRKGGDSKLMHSANANATFLLFSIHMFLGTLEKTQADIRSLKNSAFAAENLKAAIRTSANIAAGLLSDALRCTLKVPTEGLGVRTVFESSVPSFVWLWRCANGVSGQTSEEADLVFCSLCVVPALKVLSKFPTTDHYEKSELEILVASHCIAPARETFLKHKSPKDREVETMRNLLSKHLKPLSELEDRDDNDPGFGGECQDTKSSKCYGPAATFLDLATRSHHRSTLHQRTIEDPWLATLLSYITDIFYAGLGGSATTSVAKEEGQVLRQCLMICKSQGISIDRGFLETICNHVIGLGRSDPIGVDWTMLGLCIDIEPDIAVLRPHWQDGESILSAVLLDLQSARWNNAHLPRSQVANISNDPFYSRQIRQYEDACVSFVLPFTKIQLRHRQVPQLLACWGEQLQACSNAFASGISDSEKEECSVWNDERVLREISAALQSTMTDKQFKEELQAACECLDVSKSLKGQADSRFSASIVVATTIVDSLERTSSLDALEQQALLIYTSLISIIAIQSPTRTVRRYLWRLSSVCLRQWPDMCSDVEDGILLEVLLGRALEILRKSLELDDMHEEIIDYKEAFWCFNFVQQYACLFAEHMSARGRTLSDVWASTVRTLITSIDQLSSTMKGEMSWHGQVDEVTDRDTLLLGCAVILVVKSSALRCLETDVLHALLESLFGIYHHTLALETSPTIAVTSTFNVATIANHGYSWTTVWNKVRRMDEIDQSGHVAEVCKHIFVEMFLGASRKLLRKTDAVVKAFDLSFTIDNLNILGTTFLSRPQKVVVENALVDWLQAPDLDKDTTKSEALQLLHQLLSEPNKDMKSTKDPFHRSWDLVNSTFTEATMQKPEPVLTEIVKQMTELSKQSKDEFDLHDAISHIKKALKKHQNSHAAMSWICIWLAALSQDKNIQATGLSKLRTGVINSLTHRIEAACSGPFDIVCDEEFGELLDWVVSLTNTIQGSTSAELKDGQLERHCRALIGKLEDGEGIPSEVHETPTPPIAPDQRSENHYKAKLILYTIESSSQTSVSGLLSLSCSAPFYTLHQAIDNARRAFHLYLKAPESKKEAFLLGLTNNKRWVENSGQLSLMRQVIGISMDHGVISDALASVLGEALLNLIISLNRTTSIDLCRLAMDAIEAGLHNNSGFVKQYHIDHTISAVSIMTTISSNKLPSGHSHRIYRGLCKLLASIITARRKRIEGHWHIFEPALQDLLGSIYASHQPSKSKLPSPSWLNTPVGAPQAADWARLVSSLCDPPASAVQSFKSREVNDQVKKARRDAGKNLRNVLETFCDLQLKARLPPDVRSALNPGLYALLDAMGRDLRATLNSKLPAPDRAIFKAVYEDWKAFGKWGGK